MFRVFIAVAAVVSLVLTSRMTLTDMKMKAYFLNSSSARVCTGHLCFSAVSKPNDQMYPYDFKDLVRKKVKSTSE